MENLDDKTIKELVTVMIESAIKCINAQDRLYKQYGIRIEEGFTPADSPLNRVQFHVYHGIDALINGTGERFHDGRLNGGPVRLTEMYGAEFWQRGEPGHFYEGARTPEEQRRYEEESTVEWREIRHL